jgi:hypothetical protein
LCPEFRFILTLFNTYLFCLVHTLVQVAESLRRFGISAKSTLALLVRIGPALDKDEEAALQSEMSELVKVQPVSLDKLPETVDRAGLRKVGFAGV